MIDDPPGSHATGSRRPEGPTLVEEGEYALMPLLPEVTRFSSPHVLHSRGVREEIAMQKVLMRPWLYALLVEVVIPDEEERDHINTVIFDELCANEVRDESRERFKEIIDRLQREEGAEGVILGCTEIPLLIKQEDVSIPVFDTTAIHSAAAVDYSLSEIDGSAH